MKVGTRKEWLTGRGEGGELRTASATPDPLLQSEIDEQVCLPVHSRELEKLDFSFMPILSFSCILAGGLACNVFHADCLRL